MTTERDHSVDLLRTVAIAAMVWGHLGIAIYSPDGRGTTDMVLESGAPLWAEVVGGIAPGLFLFVSGMMVHYVQGRGAGLRRQLLRMAALLAIGATIDVVFWRIRPFTTVDVLYCIALALPLTHLVVVAVPKAVQPVVAVAALALGPVLQATLGYSDYPTELALAGDVVTPVANQTSVLQHWLVDGWFPLFPWLGFALCGAVVAERRVRPKVDWGAAAVGAGGLAAGLLLGYPNASARVEMRMRAGGAFMPPDPGYILASLGTVLLLLTVLDAVGRRPPRVLTALGAGPLFVYLAHFPLVKITARLLRFRLSLGPAMLAVFANLVVLTVGVVLWHGLLRWVMARRARDRPAGD